MKRKIISVSVVLFLLLSLFLVLGMNRQQAQGSTFDIATTTPMPSFTVSIIGGFILAHRTSHITINTLPETPVGMYIFYRCITGLVRTVYPNTHTNVLGRYTWQWANGAPCSAGYAIVVVNGRLGHQMVIIQKRFTIVPLSIPTPKPTPITGVNGNPWGYDFNPGNAITNPPATFCTYFDCIASFWNGSGYVEECGDGMYSLSGGNRGVCSSHGGAYQELYSHSGASITPVINTPTPIYSPIVPSPTP